MLLAGSPLESEPKIIQNIGTWLKVRLVEHNRNYPIVTQNVHKGHSNSHRSLFARKAHRHQAFTENRNISEFQFNDSSPPNNIFV